MKFPILNIDGSKTDTIKYPKWFKTQINYKLIKYVIDWQLNHSKPRPKTNKEMKLGLYSKNCCSKGKRWRTTCQQAPPFVGGGIAHGPKDKLQDKKLTKSEKTWQSPNSSKKTSDKKLYIFADVKKEVKKTKNLINF